MTTTFEVEKECAVCGHTQTHEEVMSTNTFGYMDLDTRPAEMQRSTMRHWIQMCKKCGYSNTDVDKLMPGIGPEDIRSEEYKAIVNDNRINEVAKAFLLAGHLYSKVNEFKEAGFSYMHAAWAFDDKGKSSRAKQARDKAIENMNKCLEGSADVDISILTVDLYRRSGRFTEAEETAGRLIADGAKDFVKELLEFQIKLSRNKDDKRYTVGAVERSPE